MYVCVNAHIPVMSATYLKMCEKKNSLIYDTNRCMIKQEQ